MNSFSIILPVHNGGEYVKTCVNSLLAQEYADYNIIVLDNCSTDGTKEWILSLKDSRISLITANEKLTITENWARIKGVQKNEFMTMIGHDDVLLPHYLSAMNDLVNKHPDASLYQSHFYFIDSTGKLLNKCQPMPEKMDAADFLARQLSRTMDSMGTGYAMRSADYDDLGGIPVKYPNLIFADYELWVRLCEKSYLAVSNETAFHYRLHNSVSKVTNGQDYQDAFFLYLDFLKKIMSSSHAVRSTFEKYGKNYLLYFCESLGHRILKTPVSNRSVTVERFVEKTKAYAREMLPDQSFQPERKKRISLAVWFDQNSLTRSAFKVVKKVTLLFDR